MKNKYVTKIYTMMKERNWSAYRLAQESGLYAQTIHKWLDGKGGPAIPALEQVYQAFGITMADFFAEDSLIEVSPRVKTLYEKWCALMPDEQTSVELIVDNYLKRKTNPA